MANAFVFAASRLIRPIIAFAREIRRRGIAGPRRPSFRRNPARAAVLLAGVSLGSMSGADAPSPETLSVGFEINNEPISFVRADGRPAGFAVDLVEAAAKEMNLALTSVIGPWEDIFTRFKAGEIDAIASLAYRKERDEFIDFSVPHLTLHGAVFVRKGEQRLKKLEDLAHLRIAIPQGGFTQEYLTSRGLAAHPVFIPSLAAALRSLENGQSDAIAATDEIIRGMIRQQGLKNIVPSEVDLPGFAYRYHMGVRAGDSDRLALLNEGLARIHANGTYDRIYEKWIGPLRPRPLRFEDLEPYLLPAAGVLALVLGGLLWQRSLLLRMARQAAALRRSEEQLTLVLEGSEDGFWDWDLRTGRIERSKRWASMLGYGVAEIPPTTEGGRALIHPEDLSAYDTYKTRLTSGSDNRHDCEYRMKTQSGEWRWILERGKVVARAPNGAPLRVAGTHTDITVLKRAQQELARQEAQFRFIYENAPVGLSWLHRQREETRLVNPAHERITGVPESKSRDTANYIEATHPEDRARQIALQERLDRGEIDHFSMEKRYLHPEGKIVWAMITQHRYLDPVTREAQTVTTLVDITNLKRAEEERQKLHLKILDTQKLESLGVLAGGIAHDFNNLLTVILANASFVRLDSPPDAPHAQHLEHIEIAAHRAADLCRQMLAYAGKGNFVVERLDLDRLVQDTAQLLQISISKKARLIMRLGGDAPLVEADASQLQQVVMNLVINASDALGDGAGEIRLHTWRGRPAPATTGVLHSFDLPPGDCACLEISDTGHGMDAATLARIFDPFFTTKFTGRGLGLAAVLGIVRTCRGALMVESAPKRGTTFRLYLPAASVAPVEPLSPTSSAAPVEPRRGLILIADDEPAVRATFDNQLRRHGYHTALAADGHEAVRVFRADPHGFTALLLDLTMPGLDGAEVLREVRALNPSTRVLVMSGFSEQEVLDRLRGLGPVVILHKPFTLETLLARLAES